MDPVTFFLLTALFTSPWWVFSKPVKTAAKTAVGAVKGSVSKGSPGRAKTSTDGGGKPSPGGTSKGGSGTGSKTGRKSPGKTTRPVPKTSPERGHETSPGNSPGASPRETHETTGRSPRRPLVSVSRTTTNHIHQTTHVTRPEPPKTTPGTTGTTTGGAVAGTSPGATENVEAHMNAADELAKKAQDFADTFETDIVQQHEQTTNDAEALGLDGSTGDWVDATNMWREALDKVKQAAEKTQTTATEERSRYAPSVEAVGAAGYADKTTAGQIRPQ